MRKIHNRGNGRNWRVKAMMLLLGAAICLPACTGCKAVVLLGYLISGPPSIEPEFDKQIGVSLKDDEKKILVVCYAPKELKFDVDDVDQQLARAVAMRLSSHKMKVINPSLVQNWLDRHDDWDSAAEVGEALEADWVIYIDMQEYTLHGDEVQNLYRGKTTARIQVFDMSDEDGQEVFTHELESMYPLRAPVPTGDMPRQRFKELYMSRLSEEIGRLFYEHYAGDDIAHGVLNN